MHGTNILQNCKKKLTLILNSILEFSSAFQQTYKHAKFNKWPMLRSIVVAMTDRDGNRQPKTLPAFVTAACKNNCKTYTEAIDDDWHELGDRGSTHSDAVQQLALFFDEAFIVENGAHITEHRQLTVQQVTWTWRNTVCNQPCTRQLPSAVHRMSFTSNLPDNENTKLN